MILVPSTLATLPRAAIPPGKKLLASPVHSLVVERSGGNEAATPVFRRKQRPEVVLALPGGAVQVYDMRAAKLITSYAAPPDTKFVCQSASVLLHPPANAPKLGRRRVTVAAVQPAEAASGVKLVLWEERLGRNVPLQDRVVSRQKDVQAGALVKIDVSVVVSGAEEKLCVVGVEENGTVLCWSEELDKLSSLPQTEPSIKTEAAFLLDLENARKGLLQGRDDIAITAASAGMQDVIVSVQVAEGAEDESRARRTVLKIHSIRPSAPGSLRSAARIDELATIALPDSNYVGKHAPKFFTHSGRLLQQSKKHLTVYRLTGTAPKVEHEVGFNDQVSSMVPISSSTVAAVSSCSIEILDIKHKAVLGSHKLSGVSGELGEPKVNETNGLHPERTRIQLVSFNASSGSLVAIRDHAELVSFAIGGDDQDNRPRKKPRQSALADAVGRGMQLNSGMRYSELSIKLPHKFGTLEPHQPLPTNWQETVSQLDQAINSKDNKAFEDLVRPLISDPSRAGQLNPELLDMVLTRIFKIDSGSRGDKGQQRVVIKFWPIDTVALLAGRGCLTQSQLELTQKRQGGISAFQSLEPHAIVKSVGTYDRSLRTLEQLLNIDGSFSTGELICAVGIGLRRINQIQNLSSMRLLTDGEVSMQNGQGHESDHEAEEDPDNMESYSRQLIETALARLQGTRPQQLHAALAAELQHAELLVLVDHLRVSVADSGWLSHYADSAPDISQPPSDAAGSGLPFILLNAALDVLGSSAWLRGTAARAPDAATTLSHMRTEITAALECVEESAYLSGLLHEVLLYARTVPRGAAAKLETTQQEDEEQGGGKGVKKGPVKPVLVASADDDGLDAAGVLPLGLKHQAPQELEAEMMLKVKAGGRMERRSTREVGHLKSMRVGKHTLERITF